MLASMLGPGAPEEAPQPDATAVATPRHIPTESKTFAPLMTLKPPEAPPRIPRIMARARRSVPELSRLSRPLGLAPPTRDFSYRFAILASGFFPTECQDLASVEGEGQSWDSSLPRRM